MTMLLFSLWNSPTVTSRRNHPSNCEQWNRPPARKVHVCNFISQVLASKIVLIFCLSLSIPFNCNAFELFDSVQIHGFVSQAMFLSSGNGMFTDNKSNPNFEFTELGINGSWYATPNLRLSMQVLSRRAGRWDNGSPVIDFGLMDYSFSFDSAYRVGIRAGRVRQPYGLYNDTRDVAFTRPSILLPQSIYLEGARDLTISGDGLILYGESTKPWGNLTLELFGGYPRTESINNQFQAVFGYSGVLESNPSFVGRFNYETYNGRLRFALTGAYTTATASKSVPSPNGLVTFAPMIFSAQYTTDKWTLTSEYDFDFFKGENLGLPGFPINPDFNYFGQKYYFQAAYRFNPQWELMARYDAMYPNSHDQSGYQASIKSKGLSPDYSHYAKTMTVGLRWDITPMMMIRAEYNYINGTAWLPVQGVPTGVFGISDNSQTSKYWDLFGLQVSIRF